MCIFFPSWPAGQPVGWPAGYLASRSDILPADWLSGPPASLPADWLDRCVAGRHAGYPGSRRCYRYFCSHLFCNLVVWAFRLFVLLLTIWRIWLIVARRNSRPRVALHQRACQVCGFLKPRSMISGCPETKRLMIDASTLVYATLGGLQPHKPDKRLKGPFGALWRCPARGPSGATIGKL